MKENSADPLDFIYEDTRDRYTIRLSARYLLAFLEFMTLMASMGVLQILVIYAGNETFEELNAEDRVARIDGYYYLATALVALFFCKDNIAGRSIVKRLMGYQVVRERTGLPAGPFRCVVRNLFTVLWPIELVALLFNKGQRLGDLVAGTALTYYKKPVAPQPLPYTQIAAATIVTVAAAMLCTMYMQHKVHVKMEQDRLRHAWEEKALDPVLSAELKTWVAPILADTVTTRVRAYHLPEMGDTIDVRVYVNTRIDIVENGEEIIRQGEEIKERMAAARPDKYIKVSGRFTHYTASYRREDIQSYDF